jgi:hypothetical protein
VLLTDPQTWNLYTYSHDNPATDNDPTGLQGSQNQSCVSGNSGTCSSDAEILRNIRDVNAAQGQGRTAQPQQAEQRQQPPPPPPPPPPAPHVEYKQRTGETSVKIGSPTILPLGTGYAGHGQGLNNPGSQSVGEADDKANAGPLPQGGWTIGPAVNNNLGSPAMHLHPDPGTKMFGRDKDSFWIHADNPTKPPLSSSEGCIVFPNRAVRVAIGASGIDTLEVVP